MEDEFYMRRLDAGLFSLQLIDCIIMEVCSSGVSSVNNSAFHWLLAVVFVFDILAPPPVEEQWNSSGVDYLPPSPLENNTGKN